METPKIERKGTRKSLNSSAILVTRKLFSSEVNVSGENVSSKERVSHGEKKKDIQEKGRKATQTYENEKQQPGCSGMNLKKNKNIKSTFCADCGDDYYNPKGKKVEWYQCVMCERWFHEDCDSGSIKSSGLCTKCQEECSDSD